MEGIEYRLSFDEYTALREAAAMAKTAGDLMSQMLPTFAPKMAAEADRALKLTDAIKPTITENVR